MHSTTSLDIPGYRGEPVPNSFIRQEGETQHLAILFPGIRYTADMPVLYYPGRLLLQRGADLLRVEYTYGWREGFAALPQAEQERWIASDAAAACETGLAQRAYSRVTLVGKSIGTLAMGHLVTSERRPIQMRCVWLTPLLRSERLRAQIVQAKRPSLFVIGTGDGHYDPERLREVVEATQGESVVIAQGDHSLEVPGSVLRSLHALEEMMQAMEAFVG